MTKIKITCEFEMDFQKFYDEIPEGLYKQAEKTILCKDQIKDYVFKVLSDSYVYQLTNSTRWMSKEKELYPFAKHHLDISIEVAKQINENAKVIIKRNENK